MELITLDANFQPAGLVENYESLIWTERYSSYGDFEIHSSDINALVQALPRESYVSLRDSNVPMIVENHKLTKPLRDKPEIVITGRSMDTVLERRGSVNALSSTEARLPWYIEADKESDAAYLAMRIVLGDVAQMSGLTEILPLTAPAVSPLDAIPEVHLIRPADYVDLYTAAPWSATVSYTTGQRIRYAGYIWTAVGPNFNVEPTTGHGTSWTRGAFLTTYEIKPQNLYDTINQLITINHRGLKSVRPIASETTVGIEIYNGADLTDLVVIDARFDQIDSSTYLLSAQGSTNVGYVYGADGAQTVLKTTAPEPGGLARRVLVLDDSTDSATVGSGDVTSSDIRRSRGLIELYKYNATALFDGQVAEQIAAGFNRDYFLGDILKLVGEFGLSQDVRVTEFIRSSDSTGQKAYPTFEAVDE